VYTFEDRTELRRLEREIGMRERLAAVGRLAAGIAHEIRNPLASISGSIKVLAQISPFNDEQQTLLDIVSRESARLNSIISDFLAYSREKSYKFSRVDLISLLEDTLVLLENRSHTPELEIVRRYSVDEAFVTADADRMKQVFWNLLENAVRAMNGKGTITVSVEPQGDYWSLTIRDTGPGIPGGLADKIFEPFQSKFEGGTGLGLAIVYQIVQAHGARIFARSGRYRGAEFVLEIVHARAAEPQMASAPVPAEVSHGSICEMLDITLRKEGHRVETVNGGEAAKRKLSSANYEVLITDIKMPQTDGIEVLQFARQSAPETSVILITAVEDYEAAVQAVKAGAFDYIHKGPGLVEELKISLGRALSTMDMRRQNFALKRDAAMRNSLDNIIGKSSALEKLKATIRTVAPTGSTVLIQGESGTGKELVARAVHACSPRGGEPFVSVNCGAFPETLLESELFGYVKGAFTGASQNKRGLFEVASGGTIFLDEISEMTLSMQVKLLRVLQERSIRPVGGTQETAIDVRVIAATNRNLQEMVAANTFREDLYYRVSVIPVQVPPLRERRDDIELLANYFLKKYATAARKSIVRINEDAMAALRGYGWPGNVRQLENTIERAVALESGDELRVELDPERPLARAAAASANGHATVPPEGLDFEGYVAQIERSLIEQALNQAGGVQTRAADLLKVSYRSFRHLVKKYGI
jgi:two-component system response regulator PilR (NtrC family)